MYLGEYGSDAFSSVINQVDEDQQADMLQSLTNEIFAQSSVNGSGPCRRDGFEWNDEWWKSPGDGWGSRYSSAPSWTNDAYPDPGIYEEWWIGGHLQNPSKGLHHVQEHDATERALRAFYRFASEGLHGPMTRQNHGLSLTPTVEVYSLFEPVFGLLYRSGYEKYDALLWSAPSGTPGL